jgi:AcrR family transcriptional regulator
MTHGVHDARPSADLRVQRTHKLIREALLELTVQKGFSNVTVRDITKHAGINRATFYRHYQDKFDLLDQYAEAVYELLDAPDTGSLMIGENRSEKPPSGLVRMLEHIRTNAKFYRVMLGKNGDPAFAEKIRKYVEKRMRLSFPDTLVNEGNFVELNLSYMSSGSVGAVLWWLDHDMPYSPEELAAISYRLGTASLQAMLG